MSLPQNFLDELRARLPLSTIVGRAVRLTRAGREFKGCCPFHNEKTPSFTVNDDKGFYHCFGCGAHGDVITFVMNNANMTFPEAVERLAGEAGLEVPRASPAEQKQARRRAGVLEVVEAACVFYEQQLFSPAGQRGLEYLQRRGLDAATIRHFRLGWAPRAGALRTALTAPGRERDGQKIDDALLVEAGLLKRRDDGSLHDYFRERVMFPITDRRGRVIAFGGRVLDDSIPKYLNSPDTPLFSKGTVLYGLAQARQAAGERREIIAVEGYMDTIALARAGFPQTVAPLGTALTESQLEELWRLADEPILCFDGDTAGQRAARRAMERALPLLRPGKSLRLALMQGAKDPDELLRSQGHEAMRHILDQAAPLFAFLWQATLAEHPVDTPERRAALEHDLYATVERIGDRTVQHHYRQQVKQQLWNLFRALDAPPSPAPRTAASPSFRPRPAGGGGSGWSAGPAAGRGNRNGSWKKGAPPPRPSYGQVSVGSGLLSPHRIEALHLKILVATALTHPALFDRIGERLGQLDISEPWLDRLRRRLLDTLAEKTVLDFSALCDHLRAQGMGDAVASLLTPAVFSHASFARPDTGDDKALQGWEQTYQLVQRKELATDIRQVMEQLNQETTQEHFEALIAVQGQQRLGDDEG